MNILDSKIILVGIAIAAIGLVALPNTLALFAGQHNFYDTTTLGATTVQIPCEKCHADVFSELSQPGAVNGVHKALGCGGCHVTIAPQKEGLIKGPNGQFHAAALPMCLDCHSTTGPGLSALEILNGSVEAHKAFAQQANNSQILRGANAACISCHTHVAVDINWTKAYMISFSAVENATTGTHSWVVSNFATSGTVQIQTYGNRSGAINNATQPVVAVSPTPLGFDPNNP
jgi:hypothetical protein